MLLLLTDTVALSLVGIQENVHPTEFELDDAEAKLLGQQADRLTEGFTVHTRPEVAVVSQEFPVANQQAEVVGIQEDVHPIEFTEHGAEAELVGQQTECLAKSYVMASLEVAVVAQNFTAMDIGEKS